MDSFTGYTITFKAQWTPVNQIYIFVSSASEISYFLLMNNSSIADTTALLNIYEDQPVQLKLR